MSEKNASLALAEQKIQELQAQIALLTQSNEPLHVLPNGDLHRGVKLVDANKPNIDVEVITSANPLNKAMADILLAAKGGHELTCLWCGLQFGSQSAEKDVREHLKDSHPSVVEGWDKKQSDALMLSLAEAQQRLEEAKAGK